VIVENPADHLEYYFKTSLKRERKDYKHEYWSEIIASEIGSLLGFDTLRYDIAFNRGEMGCISQSMVTKGIDKLTEGISYLTGYDTTYNPEEKLSKKQYSFQLICASLKHFKLDHYIEKIIEIIIFDSIIGNSDRHQENWVIITEYNAIIKAMDQLSGKGIVIRSLFSLFGITTKNKNELYGELLQEYHLRMPGTFSQIYDSGSCLGRELEDEKLRQVLQDPSMLEAYVRRGEPEIHWNGEKVKHFELIEEISKIHTDIVKTIVSKVKNKYKESVVVKCVNDIDINLPKNLSEHKLPEERKELIKKLIVLRLEKLFKFIG
jgi:hypothetical protein